MKRITKWGTAVLGVTLAASICATFALADSWGSRKEDEPQETAEMPTSILADVKENKADNATGTDKASLLKKKLTDAVRPSLESLSSMAVAKASLETQKNAQAYIWYQMLNTVDFFDTISGTVKNEYDGNAYSYDFASDMSKSTSYQKSFTNGQIQDEIYCDISQTVTLSAKTRDVDVKSGATTWQETYELAAPVSERYGFEEDGTPFCVLRGDATNLECASLCTMPQELAFSFLTNYDAWRIVGTTTYLGRDCVQLTGTPGDYHQNKLGISTFTMYIDYETGVLLKYEGSDSSGQIVDSITVTDIHIDEAVCVPQMNDNPTIASFLESGN